MAYPHDTKILYLEDDRDSIELVAFTLGLENIQVRSVSTAEEALELALTDDFDLYLLDGLVESGYSFELCRQLRESNPDVPVVFYTALGFPQDIREGVSAGADAYLVKPFVGDLAATIRHTIEKSRGQDGRIGTLPGQPLRNSAAHV